MKTKARKETGYWEKRDLINQAMFLILASAVMVGAFLMKFLEDWFLYDFPNLPYQVNVVLTMVMGGILVVADTNEKTQLIAKMLLSVFAFAIQMVLTAPLIFLWKGPQGVIKYVKARGWQLIINEKRRYLFYLRKRTDTQ